MNFHTRKWVKPEDLNPNGTLFGQPAALDRRRSRDLRHRPTGQPAQQAAAEQGAVGVEVFGFYPFAGVEVHIRS